jgi:DNA-directed RNA polymerase subunit omega
MELPNNIDSKFRYILISAKRARQLQSGVRPLVQTPTKKTTKIAQQEVTAGLIPFEVIDVKGENSKG